MNYMLSLSKIPLDAGNSSTIRNCLLVLSKIKAVKMTVTRGQSACLLDLKLASETQCGTFRTRTHSNEWFYQWLVGIVDGDGSFTVTKSNNKWSLYFKIAQSSYNLRLLYFIKKNLGVGSVYVDPNNKVASYRLRNVNHIVNNIIPIFDKYILLTSKHYNYNKFKLAAIILNNKLLTTSDKNIQLELLLQNTKPENYISPVWFSIKIDKLSVEKYVTKPWLVGFTEREGSFYLVTKDRNRITHGFAITQKLDKIVLDAISLILEVPVTSYKTYNVVVTTNTTSISKIIDYYFNTIKGMKSLEYRIWARSFNKKLNLSTSDRFEYLSNIQILMRNIRSIRLNKNFNVDHLRPIRF